MIYIIVFDLIIPLLMKYLNAFKAVLAQIFGFLTLIPLLARNFGSAQGLCLPSFIDNYLFPILARYFGSSARLLPFFLMNNELFPILAQSFLRAQGLGSAESGIVLSYSEHFGLSRIRRDREKESPKIKTKPFQTHSKPFFRTPIPILSPKMRIYDIFMKTFLCKTKPFFSKFQIKNKGLTAALRNPRLAGFFSVDFFSQLIRIINSLLIISPLNDKINRS